MRGTPRISASRAILLILIAAASLLANPDPRVPPEVLHKSGYINPAAKPKNFSSAMLWGIAIADPRVPGFENAEVEIKHVQLSCRVDGRDRILNDDRARLHGGLYQRNPWFANDDHEPMPMESSGYTPFPKSGHQGHPPGFVILRVGTRPDRVWHFWAGSPRRSLPPGRLDGCTVTVRAKISAGALLQVGFDYWRNAATGYNSGGNNHEAGASDWYFPSGDWQKAVFSDVKHR